MGKHIEKLTEEEKDRLFQIAIKRYVVKHYGLYGRDIRTISNQLQETPYFVKTRLRKAGFVCGKSSSGCRDVWKLPSQSPTHINLEA